MYAFDDPIYCPSLCSLWLEHWFCVRMMLNARFLSLSYICYPHLNETLPYILYVTLYPESIALQPRNVTCYHGNKDAVAVFQCPITLEHVVRIRWQVNGEEHQHTGPELPLSCARELDAAEVTCVVEFKGGNSTYTAGWLNALHSDDENEEESNMSTQECDKKEDQRGKRNGKLHVLSHAF